MAEEEPVVDVDGADAALLSSAAELDAGGAEGGPSSGFFSSVSDSSLPVRLNLGALRFIGNLTSTACPLDVTLRSRPNCDPVSTRHSSCVTLRQQVSSKSHGVLQA